MNEIVSVWFEEAKKLEIGESLHIRVANKKEQTQLANEFEEARSEWAVIEPVHASQIFILKTIAERKQYIVLERKYRAPFTAVKRNANGKLEKISVDPERTRILQLMIKDRKSKQEIEEVLNGLTEQERKFYFNEDIVYEDE